MSPNNKSIHERPAPSGDDIVRAASKDVDVSFKVTYGNSLSVI